MKKRKRSLRKALLMTCCAVALVAISVGATLAYLTDNAAVTNTFTVGQVGISLSETKVDENGKAIENAARVTSNEYHLVPGQTYTKDPTVTLDAKSESSYIRMLVTVEDYADLLAACKKHEGEVDPTYHNPYFVGDTVLLQNFTDWTEASKWDFYGVTFRRDNVAATYEFRYETAVANAGDTSLALEPLFTKITLPGWMDNADLLSLEDLEINVVAHAIQAAGFEDNVDGAWTAFEAQRFTEDNPEYEGADGPTNVMPN